MRRMIIIFVVFSVLSLQFTGCQTMNIDPKIIGGSLGAALGAGAGALIDQDKPGRGALIGGGTGAILGALAGHFYEKYDNQQIAPRTEAMEKYDYNPIEREEELIIGESVVIPDVIARGEEAEARVRYTVLTPDENQTVKITETRTFVFGNERLEFPPREENRPQGTHLSTMKFTVPQDITPGDYTLITTITNGKQTKSSKAPMKII